jgi:hypothetical protein
MALPVTVPLSTNVLPPGEPDCTFIPNDPDMFPLKSPLSVNDPARGFTRNKAGGIGGEVEIRKAQRSVVTCAIEVVNESACALFVSVSVAVQLPFMFPELLLVPQPTRTSPTANKIATASFCIDQTLPDQILFRSCVGMGAKDRCTVRGHGCTANLVGACNGKEINCLKIRQNKKHGFL